MAYSGDLSVADSYSRLEHGLAQQRVKRGRDARAAAVGLPVAAGAKRSWQWGGTGGGCRAGSSFPTRARTAINNNVSAYPEQLWPTQSTETIWRGSGGVAPPSPSSVMARSRSSGALGSSGFGAAAPAGVVPSIGTREWGAAAVGDAAGFVRQAVQAQCLLIHDARTPRHAIGHVQCDRVVF